MPDDCLKTVNKLCFLDVQNINTPLEIVWSEEGQELRDQKFKIDIQKHSKLFQNSRSKQNKSLNRQNCVSFWIQVNNRETHNKQVWKFDENYAKFWVIKDINFFDSSLSSLAAKSFATAKNTQSRPEKNTRRGKRRS